MKTSFQGRIGRWAALCLALAAAVCFLCLTGPSASAEGEDELIGARIEDGVLIGYYGPGGDITIPNTVTRIAEEAFKGNTKITGVTVPGSVREIGHYAFAECTNLRRVTFSDPKDGAELIIRVNCFQNCTALTDCVIPACAKYVVANVFIGCSSMEAIQVDPDNPYYCTDENGVFYGPWVDEGVVQYDDPNLTLIGYPAGRAPGEFTIPETVNGRTVNRVWASAFRCARNLTGIEIPATCAILGGSAFEETSLTSLTIPATVTSVGACLVENCPYLTEVDIQCTLQTLPTRMFYGCSSLQRVNFPQGMNEISTEAFFNCTSLASLVIPEGVVVFDNRTFRGCANLQRVYVPASIISFPSDDVVGSLDPFEGCASNLIVYVVSGSTGEKWAFNNADKFGWSYEVVPGAAAMPDRDMGSFSLVDMGKKVKATGAFRIGNSLDVREITYGSTYNAFKAVAGDGAVKVYDVALAGEPSTLPGEIKLEFGRPAGMTSSAKLYRLNGATAELTEAKPIAGNLTLTVDALGVYGVVDPNASGQPDPTEPTAITLNRSNATVEVGKTVQLSATVSPADAADKSVTWTSSAPGVATVSSTGRVTGVSAGSCTITAATANGLTARCSVIVTAGQTDPPTPPAGDKIAADAASIRAGSTLSGGKAPFYLSLTNPSRVATIQVWFETDGSAVSFQGQNGFVQIGDAKGSVSGGRYTGTAVFSYLGGTEKLLTAAGEVTFAQLSVTAQAPTVTLTDVKISGWDESQVVAYGTVGAISPAAATFTPGGPSYDIDADGVVDMKDLTAAQLHYRARKGDAGWASAQACDVNGDGVVDIADFIEIWTHFSK